MNVVVHGKTPIASHHDDKDPYEVPKKLGIFKTVDSGNTLTTADIVARIIKNKYVEIS